MRDFTAIKKIIFYYKLEMGMDSIQIFASDEEVKEHILIHRECFPYPFPTCSKILFF